MSIVSVSRNDDGKSKEARMRTGLFKVTEIDVAKRLGLSREAVRELRVEHLYQEEDFSKVGREICYAEDGVEKLRKFLKRTAPTGITLGDIAPMQVKTPEMAVDKPEVILDAVVVKIYPHNPQYMEALLGGQPVTVRVRDNGNFIPKMVIQSRQLAMRNPKLFDFIGRCPRGRGRW